jgi:hypothetical protein
VANAVKGLIAAGLADKKLTQDLATKLEKDYAENPEGLKDLIAALPAYQSIADMVHTAGGSAANLAAKSWDDLDKGGHLEALKAQDLNTFKAKFKERFGVEYNG